jgi:hypothetical protein
MNGSNALIKQVIIDNQMFLADLKTLPTIK